jgi:hypothetical protein
MVYQHRGGPLLAYDVFFMLFGPFSFLLAASNICAASIITAVADEFSSNARCWMSRHSGLGHTIVTLWPSSSSYPVQVRGRAICLKYIIMLLQSIAPHYCR